MPELYFKGFFLGLILTSMVGPIFFAIVESSLVRGFPAGIRVGTGIWTSDVLFILACLIAIVPLSQLLTTETERVLRAGAGLFFVAFGGILIAKKSLEEKYLFKPEKYPGGKLWLKGFAINTFNPFTFLFWVGTSIVLLSDTKTIYEALPYYLGVMTTVIGGDILKAYMAHRLRPKVDERKLRIFRRLSGLGFALFGFWLLLQYLLG